jgi:hypothetical protein
MTVLSCRLRQPSKTSSSKVAARLTCVEEISLPHNRLVMAATLRVDTPCTVYPRKGIHLGQRQHQGPFTAHPLLQSLWVEVAFPHLGYVEGDLCDPGAHCLGLEAIGMSLAISRVLIWTDAQMLLALDLHGGVDHDADQLRQEIQALLSRLFK